jgi:aspartate aminotransferase
VKTEILSNRIQSISESATLEMTRRSRELIAQGRDIIGLSIGEPDFDTPMPVKEAAKKAIDQNFTHYTPVAGFATLREAIAHKLKRDNNLDFKPSQIVVSNGAKQSLANIFMSVLDPGDEVVIAAPYWVSYADIIKLAGGKVVVVKTDIQHDFKLSPEQLEAAITPRTKAFLFNSPSNPTGTVYTAYETEALARVVKKYPRVLIVSDEIYEHINFSGKHVSIASYEAVKDQVVVVNGVSKGYAMTGWRIGYIAAPQFIADACVKLQGQMTSGAGSISQMAALTAVENPTQDSAYLHNMVAVFKDRRDMLLDMLDAIPGIVTNKPQGAFYVFPDVSSYFGKTDGNFEVKNSYDFCMYLLDKAGVALVSGDAFGDPNCVRISYATSTDSIREAVRRMAEALQYLK